MHATFRRLAVLVLLAACLSRASGQPADPPNKVADPTLVDRAKQLDKEALRAYQRGDFASALVPLREALAIRRKLYPPERYPKGHPHLASSINNLGELHRVAGDFTKAEPLLHEALAMRRALYPKDRFPKGHPNLAGSLNNLGLLLHATVQYAQAEVLLAEALAMRRALYSKERFPAGHADLAQGVNNLGALYLAAGDYARAEPLYREALAIARALYPKERFAAGHPHLALSLNNLGHLHVLAGEHGKAEQFRREALAMYRALYTKERFPNGHPDLAISIMNLGAMYHQAGDYAQAEPLFREALAMCRDLFPPTRYPSGHRDLLATIDSLGRLHQAVGDYVRAAPLVREALAMTRTLYPRERFPAGHPDQARAMINLGALHAETGDHARAEPLFSQALAIYRALYPKERFPSGHRYLATGIDNLGRQHQAAGEYARAEILLREALAMRRALYPRERFPHGHPELARALINLGALHQAAGDFTRARPLHREALAMCRALYPPERFPGGHPDLVRSVGNLGTLYGVSRDYARAEPLQREALALTRTLYPADRFPSGHPQLAMSLGNLGVLHMHSGDYAKAEPFLSEALAMDRGLYLKERFPAGHPDLARSIFNRAALLHFAGEHERAEPLYHEALAMYGQLLRQFADLAAEAESRNFASSQPVIRDALLSNSRHLAASAAAYEALWDGRAVLTRLQERRHHDLLASADPETAKLAEELRLTRRSLARLLLHPGSDAAAHRQLALQLTQTKEDLEKRIATKLQLAAPRAVPAVTTVKQLQSTLPNNGAFVDLVRYVRFEHDPNIPGKKGEKQTSNYVAFVVRKGQPVARVELQEDAPIERAWAAWHKTIIAPGGDETSERAAARAFARLVWEPIRAALAADCRTVYLTPDGALAQVPWAALPLTPTPLPLGERGRGEGASVLLDEHAVCLVPHGPWLLERLTAPVSGRRQPAGDTLLAYGGIDYEGTPVAVAKGRGPRDLALVGEAAGPLSPEKRLHWAALPGTAREQAQIVALARTALKAPPIVRSGRAASTDQMLEDLPKARYAHLATHGFFADATFRSYLQVDPKLYEKGSLGERRSAGSRSPLVLSGLVLAGANRRGEDAAPDRGIVTAEALIGLRLEGLELAVLSACETGLGESGGGEGVFGLQRAFHIAGCQNVIASLWQVDDEATAALMRLFYHHLWIDKRPPLEALRQAQLTLYRHPERIGTLARARGPDFEKVARLPATPQAATRTPAHLWAGFVLSGAGR
jgi:CHAT domain-containing protein